MRWLQGKSLKFPLVFSVLVFVFSCPHKQNASDASKSYSRPTVASSSFHFIVSIWWALREKERKKKQRNKNRNRRGISIGYFQKIICRWPPQSCDESMSLHYLCACSKFRLNEFLNWRDLHVCAANPNNSFDSIAHRQWSCVATEMECQWSEVQTANNEKIRSKIWQLKIRINKCLHEVYRLPLALSNQLQHTHGFRRTRVVEIVQLRWVNGPLWCGCGTVNWQNGNGWYWKLTVVASYWAYPD